MQILADLTHRGLSIRVGVCLRPREITEIGEEERNMEGRVPLVGRLVLHEVVQMVGEGLN